MFDKPLLIFDCDGVLIDSEAIYLEEEFSTLAAKGITVDKPAYVRDMMALAQEKWRAKFSELIERQTGLPLSDDEYNAMKLKVRTRIANEVKTISGIENLLGSLKKPGCVASSTSMQWLPKKLERTKLAPFFHDAVFSGDHVENGKPAPDLFLHAANMMDDAPANAIVIEDSVNGVRAGKAAGMFTIGFTGGSHCFGGHDQMLHQAGADLVLPSHSALCHWLGDNTDLLRSAA